MSGDEGSAMKSGTPSKDIKDIETITVCVKSDGADDGITFKIKRTAKMAKVAHAYATRRGVDKTAVRLIYDGSLIKDNDTPESLEMEPDQAGVVTLEASLPQTGGGR